MNDEFKVGAVVAALALIAFSIMCISIKGCNDADDALEKQAIQKGCSYFGDHKFDCRVINQGAK